MAKADEIRAIQSLGKLNKEDAEDCYANLNMNFKNAKEGIFKIKQIMQKYSLPFSSAYECAMDPKQLQILKTMNPKG